MYFYVLQDYENRSPLARQGSRKVVFFMTYYIGVDIAKFVHYACIINHLGEVHQTSFPFDNSADGFQLFLSKFSSYDKGDVVIGFESTAHYHKNLFNFLSGLGFHCELINPILTKRFRSLNIRDVKTDSTDAFPIATFLAFNHHKENNSSFNVSELKYFCIQREDLKQKLSTEKIRFISLLDRTFPELKPFIKNTIYSKGFLNFLKFYNTAYQIKTARIDRLYNLLNENYHFMTKDKVLQIKSLASSSVSFHSVAIST